MGFRSLALVSEVILDRFKRTVSSIGCDGSSMEDEGDAFFSSV